MGIWERCKGLLIWLGGSVAGITALLYAAGYLVARSHQHLLGLFGLVEFGNDEYLQEGAKFFAAIGYTVGRRLLALLAVLAFFAAIIVPLWRALVRRPAVAARLDALRPRLPSWDGGAPARGIVAVLVLLLAIVLIDHTLDVFQYPLCVRNLLLSADAIDDCSARARHDAAALRQAILAGDGARLALWFDDVLLALMRLLGLAALGWIVIAPGAWRRWTMAPVLVALALFTLLLPMIYGVLQRPVHYPVVELTLDGGTLPGGRLFLLSRRGGDFVVWSAEQRMLVWLPASAVRRADVRTVESLFGRVPP